MFAWPTTASALTFAAGLKVHAGSHCAFGERPLHGALPPHESSSSSAGNQPAAAIFPLTLPWRYQAHCINDPPKP